MSEPKIKFELNDSGLIEVRATCNGVIFSEEQVEQARRLVIEQDKRIAELEAQLTKARAEAEKYRELLGIARDHAHAALVDTEGNVIG